MAGPISMTLKILSWNTRGLGAREKRMLVKHTIRKSKPDIVMLQETKLENIHEWDVREFTGSDSWTWSFLPSIGASGGIIVLWNKLKIEV